MLITMLQSRQEENKSITQDQTNRSAMQDQAGNAIFRVCINYEIDKIQGRSCAFYFCCNLVFITC